jgi:hypothetical protein
MEQSCTSPDGILHLVVKQDKGDTLIGFDGFPWHTHADILGELYGVGQKEVVERFIEDIVSDRSFICIIKKDNVVIDVWVTDDPSQERSSAGACNEYCPGISSGSVDQAAHYVDRANQRFISGQDTLDAQIKPLQIIEQSNGNTQIKGRNGVVVILDEQGNYVTSYRWK